MTGAWAIEAAMRQVMAVVRYNFRGFHRNPRVILSFLLGLILSYLLSDRVIQAAEGYRTAMQAAEPFIWTFGDTTAVLLASLLLLLLFSDLPKLNAATPYYLVRITRRRWLAGQFLYVGAATGLYVLWILASTMLLCIRYTFVGNQWSETAALLGYSSLGESLQVPATVKAMESISPYGCMLQVIFLLLCYSLTLSFLILLGSLLFSGGRGLLLGLAYSVYGFLLDPKVLGKLLGLEEWEMYKVRVFVGWVSPLNHGTYPSHNFGYDLLPTVAESAAVFGAVLALTALAALWRLRRYNFMFLGGR